MKGIKTIVADNTRFGNYGFQYIKGFKALEVLIVTQAGVVNTSLVGINRFPKLRQLDLAFNSKIDDRGMTQLKGLRNLESLDLNNVSFVTNIGLGYVKDCKQLQTVNLKGTKCTVNGIRLLKKHLPDVIVDFAGNTY